MLTPSFVVECSIRAHTISISIHFHAFRWKRRLIRATHKKSCHLIQLMLTSTKCTWNVQRISIKAVQNVNNRTFHDEISLVLTLVRNFDFKTNRKSVLHYSSINWTLTSQCKYVERKLEGGEQMHWRWFTEVHFEWRWHWNVNGFFRLSSPPVSSSLVSFYLTTQHSPIRDNCKRVCVCAFIGIFLAVNCNSRCQVNIGVCVTSIYLYIHMRCAMNVRCTYRFR